jgi:rhamnosyltransferase
MCYGHMEKLFWLSSGMQVEKVLFVIVLYKQTLKSSEAFKSLDALRQESGGTISLFVYDNSPTPADDCSAAIMYVHDPSNAGVSRAYNQAFSFGRKNGFRYLFLLDQDSAFDKQTIVSYSQAVAAYPNVHVFAPFARNQQKIYSPFRMVNGRGIAVSSLTPGVYSLKNLTIINSGMLISVEAFETSGGYDERFPLDFSDIAFCERLANHQFKFCLLDTTIIHNHSSSNAIQSRERFEMYLKAVLLYKLVSNQTISYWFAGFPRALKLSAQSRDAWFLKRFFNPRA